VKIRLTILSLLVSGWLFGQQHAVRPKIGLTLSGGGAKGLAHLGILKAIDSAGLQVDYVTGTSMGAIIGGLYSVGYSADTLVKIASRIDWDGLLRNQAALPSLFMEEKEESAKYVVELPWINHRFHISTGLIEGEELWLKFSELFFSVYNIKDFSKFSIPFRCISTDVGSGEAVVMSRGEIITAIRASMAIPSVFTAVDVDSTRLVDGGITRNFPVKDVKEMGADIVVGSNVATGLLPSEKVRNVFQILLQVAFFRENEDARKEVPLCDIYVPIVLDNYNMGSFADAGQILRVGMEEGRKLYPRLKRLADSLNAIYGVEPVKRDRLPRVDQLSISSMEVLGLKKTKRDFFLHTMDFELNKPYSATDLAGKVRRAFGTRYYSRITYELQPRKDSTCHIVFHVTENPLTFAKLGLHYSRFSGIGLIGNFTTRNFFTPNSRSLLSVNLGESFRVKGEHLQYLGRLKSFAFTLNTQFDRFDFISYDQFKKSGLYKQNYWEVNERLHYSANRSVTVGIGHRFEWLKYNPTIITPGVAFRGRTQFNTFFVYINHNTLDRNIFPKRGVRLEAEGGRITRQHLKVNFLVDGREPSDPDSIQTSHRPFIYTTLSAEGYLPINNKTTAFLIGQSGINFDYSNNVMNEFVIGGMVNLFRRQVLFAGLQEGSLYSAGYAAGQVGMRWQLFNSAYLTGRANILLNNIISKSSFFNERNFYSGYAVTFSYNFALGPLDLSLMYSDQTGKVQTFINLGIPF
jgi:NTE family protein